MGGVLHFLGEYVTWVIFARDKNDAKAFIVDEFPDRVFAEFHVADAFGGSAVSPNDTGLVVVIEIGGEGRVRKKNTKIGESFG